METTGRILRFDDERGFGFIEPEDGGGDVFMHANDLLDEKRHYRPGRDVEFVLEEGDRGPKAARVRLVNPPGGSGGADDEVAFRTDVTEALLASVGTLTAQQVLQVRDCVTDVARERDWI